MAGKATKSNEKDQAVDEMKSSCGTSEKTSYSSNSSDAILRYCSPRRHACRKPRPLAQIRPITTATPVCRSTAPCHT